MINQFYNTLILIIFSFLFSFYAEAQAMNGLWKGQFDYKTVGKDQVFSVEMYYYTVGNKLYGIGASYPNEGNSSGIKNTKWKVEGEWSGNSMTYTVTEILHYRGTSNLCQTECKYNLTQVGDKLKLLGMCLPTGNGFDKDSFELVDSNNCKPIGITMSRKNNQSMYITLDEIEKLKKEYTPEMPKQESINSENSAGNGASSEIPAKVIETEELIISSNKETERPVEKEIDLPKPISEPQANPISAENKTPVKETSARQTQTSSVSAGANYSSKKRQGKLNKKQRNRQRKIRNLSKKRKVKFDDCPF